MYPPEAVTVLRAIKTSQRLGFTLEKVAELLEAGAHHHGRPDAGLQARARAELADVEAKIADLTVIADTLRDALAAGCDDQPCCPLPFADLTAPGAAAAGSHSSPRHRNALPVVMSKEPSC